MNSGISTQNASGTGPGKKRGGLASTFAYSIGIRGVGALMALALNVVLARLLGVVEYGHYMALLSLSLILGGLSVRGVDNVLTRELAGEAGRFAGLRKVLSRWAVSRVAKSAFLAAAFFLTWQLAGTYTGFSIGFLTQSPWAMLAGILIIVFSAYVTVEAGAVNGYSASLKSQSLKMVLQNGLVLMLLGVLVLVPSKAIGYGDILWLQAGSYMGTFLIGIFWLRSLTHSHERSEGRADEIDGFAGIRKNWTIASRHFLLITVAGLLVNRVDVVLVSALAGPKTVGLYAAGARLAQVALMIALSINIVISPRIAKAYQEKDLSEISRLVKSSFTLTVPIAFIEIFLAWLFGPQLVRLFGVDYSSASGPFLGVVIAYAIWTSLAPAYALLSMTGREKSVANISWLVLIVNVIGILVLTPLYGANGSGAAMAVGYGAATLVASFMVGPHMRDLMDKF